MSVFYGIPGESQVTEENSAIKEESDSGDMDSQSFASETAEERPTPSTAIITAKSYL